MISYYQAAVLGLLQGFSELFPISSLGHSVILPSLFGWHIAQNDKFFLNFLVATHLATSLVLLGFFWQDWVRIIKGMYKSLKLRDTTTPPSGKIGWLLIVGTIPAGLLGLLFEKPLHELFKSGQSASFFLFLNGLLIFGAENLRIKAQKKGSSKDSETSIAKVSWFQALGIGAAQAIALIPGFSRSGASISGGLVVGLNNEDAARFSLLLATPIIGLAALVKLPELFTPAAASVRGPAFAGALCAAGTAYLAIRFLMRYFETQRLTPFSVYCTVIGLVLSLYFLIK